MGVPDNSLLRAVGGAFASEKDTCPILADTGNTKEVWNRRSCQETPCTHRAVATVWCKLRY